MILSQTVLERNGPVVTPGSLMTRFKEWVPCASLANLGNDMMCAPEAARIAGEAKPTLGHCQRSEPKQKQKQKGKGNF
jgi:hypothetical protein